MSPLRQAVWTAVVVALPLVLGDLGGRAWRARRGAPGLPVQLALLACLVLVPCLTTVALRGPGVWDVALAGLLCWLGVRGGLQVGAWGRALARVALGLVVAEALAWAALGPPPGGPPPELGPWASWSSEVRNLHGGTWSTDEEGCRFAYAEPPALPSRPRVLHVGDSMVAGSGVQAGQTFVAALGRLRPGEAQVAAAVAGVSTDVELLAARRWLAAGPWDRVVLYVFAANDLAELDRAYPCCPGGPMLEGVAARCAEPRPTEGWRTAWRRSPPPFALRTLAQGSRAAGWAHAAWASMQGGGLVQPSAERLDAAVERVAWLAGVLVQEVEAQGGEATVVLLRPVVPSVDAGAEARTSRLREALEAVGVPLLDTEDFARGAQGAGLTVDGMHLSPEGHEAFAAWLEGRLGAE